jgi:hypothetical protein
MTTGCAFIVWSTQVEQTLLQPTKFGGRAVNSFMASFV